MSNCKNNWKYNMVSASRLVACVKYIITCTSLQWTTTKVPPKPHILRDYLPLFTPQQLFKYYKDFVVIKGNKRHVPASSVSRKEVQCKQPLLPPPSSLHWSSILLRTLTTHHQWIIEASSSFSSHNWSGKVQQCHILTSNKHVYVRD